MNIIDSFLAFTDNRVIDFKEMNFQLKQNFKSFGKKGINFNY